MQAEGGDRNKVEGFFKDKDYDLTCGPSNCQTKKPSAGVGCASRKGKAEVITPEHLTKAFEDAWEMGRVEKHLVDLGWEKMIVVYNIYGQSGGSKEDKAVTEAIIAAIRAGNEQEQHLPTIIMGDINANPESLHNIKELVDEGGWIDVRGSESCWLC